MRLSLALVSAIIVLGCGPDTITIEQVHDSPDRAFTARFYVISGGGAAGYVHMLVSVLPYEAEFDAKTHRDFVFAMENAYDLTLRWSGPRELVIEYPAWANVGRRVEQAGPVGIRYMARPCPDTTWSREMALKDYHLRTNRLTSACS